MTIEQFGQTIKAKYPQYSDMADADIGTRMLAKYPQYQDMVQGSVQSAPAEKPFSPGSPGNASNLRADNFIANQFLGAGPVDKNPGLVKGLIQSTVGSQGLAGVAQLPGRVAAAQISAGTANSFADSAAQLQETNNKLAAAYGTVPPEKRKELHDTIIENDKMIAMLFKRANGDTTQNLQDYNITPGQALGTGANAALTAFTAGGEALAPKVISKFAPALAKTELVAKGANVVSNVFGSASGLTNLAGRALEGAATGAAFQAAGNLANDKNIGEGMGTAAIIGGSIPLAGAVLSKGKELLGRITSATGRKIQTSVLRPSAVDRADGFNVKNINKYDLGGPVDKTYAKGVEQLNALNARLSETLKSAGDGTTVDLKKVYQDTVESLLGRTPGENFGNNKQITSVLKSLSGEIKALGTTAPDLSTAQVIKRAAGTKGAWQYGNFAPDAKATEIVYNTFYNKLKVAIEKNAPPGVKEINKQMQEIIPIVHAALKRIPIAERNNVISLSDAIGLFSTIAHPSSAGLVVLNKLSKSGTAGKVISNAGSKLLNSSPSKTAFGSKIFGK